ncbi:PTS fructose transporter subunit IIB, partial [Listeria monocytogenes]
MKVVGVTSCIAGLAHTPMAAKALEKAGVKLGHDVKIEQQGAMGTIDEITPAEVSAADVVIIAADKV